MSNSRTCLFLLALAFVSACSGDAVSPELSNTVSSPLGLPAVAGTLAPALPVSTVDALYTAINDPANAGKRIQLAKGTYILDGTRANGGRLELRKDMTLTGVSGHSDQVVIDASGLSAAALTDAGQVTGAIRTGRGNNTVEWLSIVKTINGAAGITTDLFLAGPTIISISHVTASGGIRGFDIRNVGAAAAGRVLEVNLRDNDLANNTLGGSQGLRIANLAGAKGARIHASLSGNSSHGNIAGLIAANVSADSATVDIESDRDHFDNNGNGAIILGGNATGSATIRGSLVRFSAFKSTFQHNTGTLPAVFPTRAGIASYGGVSTAADRAFNNRVELTLKNIGLGDNGGPEVRAWGAITTASSPAGTGNVVSVVFNGNSKKLSIETIGSDPAEPAGTNKVTVQR
ncbi:MAG: hypothetical protein ABJC63_12675 [Gemmatimonadales bacterium]